MDIRQAPEYAQYIKSLGWQVEKLRDFFVFIKKFPLIGTLIKIQRISPPIPFTEIEALAQKYKAFQVVLEPSFSSSSLLIPDTQLTSHPQPKYRPLHSPFIPTKTLVLDLTKTKEEIFAGFSKNKRRDLIQGGKKGILIKEGSVEEFIALKKEYLRQKWILPLGTEKQIRLICKAFGSKAKILIAYPPSLQPLAGLLLLFHQETCYYWQAAATQTGKKILAPTLLLWEAIKLAKECGCQVFDFEGIYDERFPENKSWQGFTHFKLGFGGKEVLYPLPLGKKYSFFRFF